ncbi:MAG: glycosyltransferase [Lachnospiraceae bacterium]|nr:glycosyltransferase [Lachnospiraceae bacterium]
MNVCLLNDSFPPIIDGVANTVKNYADILTADGLADVLVGTPKYPDVDYGSYPYKVVAYKSFDTTRLVNGYRAGNPFVIKELIDMEEFAPDIIHSHCPVVSTILARALRTRLEAPIVFTYHTKFDVDIAKAVRTDFLRKESVRALVSNIEACDEVWTVSRGAGENLRSLGYEGEYRVVSNGVDFPKGRADDEKVSEVTGSYDLPEDVPVFLFVGRIMKYKGLPLIVDALSRLSADGTDFRMVFVGGGPDMEEIKEMARTAGIYSETGKSRCIFTGPVYDRQALRAWNTRADLFLFPSTYDTNGIVVREAAACALASVLIDGSCAAEGIEHDRNGFIIDENAESMYRLLRDLSGRRDHMKHVGENAMNEIYISWSDSVHEAYERYNTVIENKRAGVYNTKRHKLAGTVIEFTDDVIYEMRELFKFPVRFMEGMRDNFEDFFYGGRQ